MTHSEPSLNAWHHVVATIRQDTPETGEKQLYVDGNLVKTRSYSFRGSTTEKMKLGETDALLDEVRFYERVLTSQR